MSRTPSSESTSADVTAAVVRTTVALDEAMGTDPAPLSAEAVVERIRQVMDRLELERVELGRVEDGGIVEVQLARSRSRELGLGKGDRVFLKPRNLRVFLTPVHGAQAGSNGNGARRSGSAPMDATTAPS